MDLNSDGKSSPADPRQMERERPTLADKSLRLDMQSNVPATRPTNACMHTTSIFMHHRTHVLKTGDCRVCEPPKRGAQSIALRRRHEILWTFNDNSWTMESTMIIIKQIINNLYGIIGEGHLQWRAKSRFNDSHAADQ